MFKTWIPAAAAALLFATAVQADTNRRTAPLTAPAAEKPLSAPVVAMTATAAATVSYPGTLPSSPTFNRPSGCTGLSGVGTAVSFHQQSFTVDTAGDYTLTVLNTSPAIDTVMVLYQGTFSSASPLTNCIAYNDDAAGISPLSRITQTLATGTTYVLVTTTFDNGVVASFNNEITGPGGIALVGAGPSANLGLSKSAPDGVVNGGTYRYVLAASNAGPDNATGVTVTDTLPAGVSFVSSTCGATAAGQTVTWPIGALANGGSASCTLTVSRASLTCSTVVNTATISGTQADPNPANNTATHSNGGGEVIVDGSFEAPSAPAWAQASSNFGSPLCDEANCGNGGGSAGPRTGAQWIWFGGAGANLETGSVEQSVAIPAGATSLSFGYRLGLCGAGAGANDFVRLTIGGTEVWRLDASSPLCGAAAYSLANVDVSSFAGSTRLVRFESTTGSAGVTSNFSIDDVSLVTAPVCVAPPNADLSITQTLSPAASQIIGNTVSVGLTVANAGPGPASGVSASTVLPAQLVFVSSTCGATAVGQTVTWAVGALANGASASCTLTTRIATGGAISVSSSVGSTTTDPVSTNNTASANLAGAPLGAPRPAVVPSLNAFGLLALVLSLLAVGGFAFGRRER